MTDYPAATRAKSWFYDCSLTEISGSNPLRGCGYQSQVSVLYCQVEISATGRSLVQRSPTKYAVSECEGEASLTKRPWPARGCRAMDNNA